MYLGTRFAIASESYPATRTGYEVYKTGGNAVDAIAAASIVLTYVLPHLGGVGGDFLALVHRGGRIEAVVGFGWTPKGVPRRPPRRGFNLPWSRATWRGFTNSTDATALSRGSA